MMLKLLKHFSICLVSTLELTIFNPNEVVFRSLKNVPGDKEVGYYLSLQLTTSLQVDFCPEQVTAARELSKLPLFPSWHIQEVPLHTCSTTTM